MVFRGFHSPLMEMDDAEVFRLLVLYANHCRKTKNPEGFKFFLDGQRIHEDEVLDLLPEHTDKSLLGYHQRMNEMFEDYCLVCDELLRVNLKKQALLSEFTGELYRHVGFPNRFAEMGLYLGNYRKTPFGVHVDACGVFSFPVVGTKRFRLWEPAYVAKNPGLIRAFKYDKYKAKSLLMEVRTGDLSYWPSSSWHIAESDGSFSATWSLGVWVDRPHREMIQESVSKLIASKLGSDANLSMTSFSNLHAKDGEVLELPKIATQSLTALQNLTAEDFKSALLKDWMIHISKEGFKTPPRNEKKVNVSAKSVLQLVSSPLLWNQPNKSELTVCFAGTCVDFAGAPAGVLKLIKDLNRGKSCLIDSYIKGPKHLSGRQTLANAGAVQAVSKK